MSRSIEEGRIYIELTDGRRISLDEVHIQISTLGVLEGHFDAIRTNVLAGIEARARHLFGSQVGVFITYPAAEELPTYVIYASLVCFEPVIAGDLSSLVLAWFEDRLPRDIEQTIAERARLVNWANDAVDGLL